MVFVCVYGGMVGGLGIQWCRVAVLVILWRDCDSVHGSIKVDVLKVGVFFIPPATKLYWNHHVRLSVCQAAFGFPVHNCFPFTRIIMKLHMQTPHEARVCPIDFEVKRSKVKVTMHKLLKMVSVA